MIACPLGSLSNFSACYGKLVKVFITLKPYGIFGSNCAYFLLNIVQPLVCKTVARVCRASFWPVEVFK